MRLFPTGKLDEESKQNQQQAVNGITSTDNPDAPQPPSEVARLFHLLSNHGPIGDF